MAALAYQHKMYRNSYNAFHMDLASFEGLPTYFLFFKAVGRSGNKMLFTVHYLTDLHFKNIHI